MAQQDRGGANPAGAAVDQNAFARLQLTQLEDVRPDGEEGGGGPTYYTYLFSLYIYDTAFKYFDMGYGAALAWVLFLVVAVFASIAFKSSKYWVFYSADKGGKNG